MDRSPAKVFSTLLDEDIYLCSERTMYRVLASQAPVQDRRAQRSHPECKKPELMATGPNQVWSWDITRLLGPKKWSYTRSLSRPQVSDDNPFSEAQFKTLKYHPSFPGRFQDRDQAKTFCRSFFRWYNGEHRHGGIAMLTPEHVHFGHAGEIVERRESRTPAGLGCSSRTIRCR